MTDLPAHRFRIAAKGSPVTAPATMASERQMQIAALLDIERGLWRRLEDLRPHLYTSVGAELERETGPHHIDAVDGYAAAAVAYTTNLTALLEILWPTPSAQK